MRVIHISSTQQKIIKLHLDGLSNDRISKDLNVSIDDVYSAIMIADRTLPKRWKVTAKECWRLLKEWNVASTLVLAVCVLPLFESSNHDQERVKTPKSSRLSRGSRRQDEIDIFELFEFC